MLSILFMQAKTIDEKVIEAIRSPFLLKRSRIVLKVLNQIFEDRFIFEKGAYRAYVTDEKMNIDQKDIQIYA